MVPVGIGRYVIRIEIKHIRTGGVNTEDFHTSVSNYMKKRNTMNEVYGLSARDIVLRIAS
jgi:hypothetical protein